MSYIFLDTETTGLVPSKDRIIQLSYILADEDFKIVEGKNFYLDIDTYIPEEATNVHGIDNEKILELSQGKKFEDYSKEILWDFSNSKIICHNVDFDVNFLRQELWRLDKKVDIQRTFCTMKSYTNICELDYNGYYESFKWPKLEEVVEYLKLDVEELKQGAEEVFGEVGEFHDARLDVYTTYEIYKNIKHAVIDYVIENLENYRNDRATRTAAIKTLRDIDYLLNEINEFETGKKYIDDYDGIPF